MSKQKMRIPIPQEQTRNQEKKILENMKTTNMLRIVEELEAEAKNGNRSAQFVLGVWYFLIGLKDQENKNADFAEALKWLQLSEVHDLSDMIIQAIVSNGRNRAWFSGLGGSPQTINLYGSGPMPTPNPPMPMPTHPMPPFTTMADHN